MPHQPDMSDEELRTGLRQILIAAMERGNLYDGYVASAEFNAEAHKVCADLLPIAERLIKSREQQVAVEAIDNFRNYYLKSDSPDNVFKALTLFKHQMNYIPQQEDKEEVK